MVGEIIFEAGTGFFDHILKHILGRGAGTKSWTFQKVQGYSEKGSVGTRRFQAHHLAGGVEVGDVAVFQVREGGGNGQGEDLPHLEGGGRIHMEKRAAQTDIPEDALALIGGIRMGEAGMELHRKGYRNPVKASSFQGWSHEAALTIFLDQLNFIKNRSNYHAEVVPSSREIFDNKC